MYPSLCNERAADLGEDSQDVAVLDILEKTLDEKEKAKDSKGRTRGS